MTAIVAVIITILWQLRLINHCFILYLTVWMWLVRDCLTVIIVLHVCQNLFVQV